MTRKSTPENFPDPLPDMPQTFTAWVASYLETTYPDATTRPPRDELIAEFGQKVPRGLLPSVDALIQKWIVNAAGSALRALGLRSYSENGEGPELVVEELQLPLEGIVVVLTRDLIRAHNDVASAEARWRSWVIANPAIARDIDVDAVWERDPLGRWHLSKMDWN